MSQIIFKPVNSPSFSSSLLDKVFRSIDESDQPTTTNHTTRSISSSRLAAQQSASDTKSKKTEPNRRKLDAETTIAKPGRNHTSRDGPVSASCDHADRKLKPNDVTIGVRNLKPIRTSTARTERCDYLPDTSRKMSREGYRNSSKPKVESAFASSPSSSFQNAKTRAQKMYGDLKDVKQPISPGGRLTRFITSLFSKRNSSSKSEKFREAEALRTRHEPATTCYSASSYYRSCLRNKPTDSSKNSVRFCPVNIVIDDERRENPRLVASGQKCELDGVVERTIKQRMAQSNLKELLKKYARNGVSSTYDGKLSDEDGHDDDDDDDGGSCASSDLFELDHIGGNVSHSINDELPVYGSTAFRSKNPAICPFVGS